MRFLLLLPWCFLFSPVAAEIDCNWEIPTDHKECTQTIQWKVRDNKQATATCREFFATTFVEGTIHPSDPDQVKCTVSRQFQCDFLNTGSVKAVPMFDKCYIFHREEVSIDHYLKNRNTYCKAGTGEGGIPVFFTMTQAKHIAKKAHRESFYKMWVNVDRNGQTIEESHANGIGMKKGFLLYKDQWKTHKATYWSGDELKATPTENDKDGNPQFKAPDGVDFMFFRTRTDTVYNLIQGSFEQADKDAKASIVCEYKAKIVPDQEKYCGKMKELGLNAMYDNSRGRKRCVYTSLSTYSLEGTEAAINNFPGCKEKPSNEHLAGLDDGTASQTVYNTLTTKGTYRMAAIKIDTKIKIAHAGNYDADVRKHCDPSATFLDTHRQPYAIYDHSKKMDFSSKMTSNWEYGYPKDECSDFSTPTMNSNTLAIRKQQIIDVPVPVRFPAICSIETNVDCALNKDTCRADQKCKNVESWNPLTNLYTQCECPKFHKEDTANKQCIWDDQQGDHCAKIHRWNSNDDWGNVPKKNRIFIYDHIGSQYSDNIDEIVVRKGCIATVWSHPPSEAAMATNFPLLSDVKYGEHVVPNHNAKTLNGWGSGQSASGIDCQC